MMWGQATQHQFSPENVSSWCQDVNTELLMGPGPVLLPWGCA